MRRASAAVLAALLCLFWSTLGVNAEDALKGVALVIGQSKYSHISPLPNPSNDAREMVKLLTDLGFDARGVSDRDAQNLTRDLERFVEDAEGADVAFLYYSGHGIEAGGENYLVPVDAGLGSLDNAAEDLVAVSTTLEELKSKVPVTILLLDACRTNPFPVGALVKPKPDAPGAPIAAGGLSPPRGVTVLDTAPAQTENLGVVIGFAAEPGRPALDGDAGGNSPYAAALLRHLAAMKGEEFGAVMRMVTEEVYLATKAQQRPWTNESLRRLLYFGVAPEEPEGEEGLITGERRRLLLTISALPSLERKQVETIASADGVPLDALYGVLRALGNAETPDDPDELTKLLKSQADKLRRMMDERAALSTDDPELKRLADAAERAIDQGAIDTARKFLDEAVKRVEANRGAVDDAEARVKERRLADAAIYARRAEAETLAFDHLAAARDYAEAFALAEKWDEKLRWNYKNLEAEALNAHGNAKGDAEALERAIAAYQVVLGFIPAGEKNRDWAITRNNMGVVLQTLGERDPDPRRLEEAAQIFRESLDIFTRENDMANWAAAQNNLGNALLALGMRDNGTERLEQAVEAFRATFKVRTRGTLPLEWASSQNNLGISLYTLGEREATSERLEEAEAAYRAGLEEATRERDPQQWAMLQNNLGNTLNTLGVRKNDPAKLAQAAEAFNAALQVRTRETFPLKWAATQVNLGNVFNNLGRFDTGTERLEQAIAAYRLALEVYDRKRVPYDWASAQNNLGSVLQMLGQRTQDAARLNESAAAFSLALEEYDRKRVPLDWAMAQNNLGNTLQIIGKLTDDVAKLNDAIAAHRAALEEYSRERSPAQWAIVHTSLAAALEALASRESGTTSLEAAIAARRSALEILTRDTAPVDWALSQFALGTSLASLGDRGAGTDLHEQARAAYAASLTVITRDAQPLQWAFIQNSIGDALVALGNRKPSKDDLGQAVATYEQAREGFKSAGIPMLADLTDRKIELVKGMLASP